MQEHDHSYLKSGSKKDCRREIERQGQGRKRKKEDRLQINEFSMQNTQIDKQRDRQIDRRTDRNSTDF